LSWQVVPARLTELMLDKNAAKAKKVTEAMFKMRKIDLQKIEEAYAAG
jgi:predicted 3-demethylubiquinone-9 3-methyltransferase (glyoxalase superfamily)